MTEMEQLITEACNKEGVAKHCPQRITDTLRAEGYTKVQEIEFPSFDVFMQTGMNGVEIRKGLYIIVIRPWRWAEGMVTYSKIIASAHTYERMNVSVYAHTFYQDIKQIPQHDEQALRQWYSAACVDLNRQWNKLIHETFLEE